MTHANENVVIFPKTFFCNN